MNKFLLTPIVFLFFFQIGFIVDINAQGGAPRVLDNGAAAACTADPISFFNEFTGSEEMKFEFRTMSPTAAERENGVMFQIDAVIATAGPGSKIVANSIKARKVFKPGETFTPNQLFNSNELLFSNKHFSKLNPGRYKVIFSMAAANPADRKRYKSSRKIFQFVWK